MSTGSSSGSRVRLTHFWVRGDFSDPVLAWHRFLEKVNRLHVTVINSVHHVFPGGGLSGLVLIGESHAAIHTWPEEGRAWCELATCGRPSDLETFERLMRES